MLNMSENTSSQKNCDLRRQKINMQGYLYIFNVTIGFIVCVNGVNGTLTRVFFVSFNFVRSVGWQSSTRGLNPIWLQVKKGTRKI